MANKIADYQVVSINVLPEHWQRIQAIARSEGLSASSWFRVAMVRAIHKAEAQAAKQQAAHPHRRKPRVLDAGTF